MSPRCLLNRQKGDPGGQWPRFIPLWPKKIHTKHLKTRKHKVNRRHLMASSQIEWLRLSAQIWCTVSHVLLLNWPLHSSQIRAMISFTVQKKCFSCANYSIGHKWKWFIESSNNFLTRGLTGENGHNPTKRPLTLRRLCRPDFFRPTTPNLLDFDLSEDRSVDAKKGACVFLRPQTACTLPQTKTLQGRPKKRP